MLWQSGSFRENQDVAERVLDSMDLEREKGITILAKNTAVRFGGVKVNIVDTPGHADFGGEVERALTMVDGVLLLVDASEGPLAADAVRPSQGARGAPAGDPRRQQGRPAGRPRRRGRRRRLPAVPRPRRRREPDRVPDRLLQRESGPRRPRSRRARGRPASAVRRAARADPGARPTRKSIPLQAHVTNLDASPYVGRLALCRIREGTIRNGQQIAWCRADGRIERAKVTELYVTEALDRVEADEAGPGELVAVAGLPDVTIGETLADPDDPRPLSVIGVDEPSLAMTLGINTSPLSGQDGDRLTASMITFAARPGARRERLAARPSDRAPRRVGGAGTWRAAARGAGGAHASRGVRAVRGQAAGRHAGDRRRDARAGGAALDRRARGVRRA